MRMRGRLRSTPRTMVAAACSGGETQRPLKIVLARLGAGGIHRGGARIPGDVGLHAAWMDTTDVNRCIAQFSAQRLCEATHREFTGGVGGLSGGAASP